MLLGPVFGRGFLYLNPGVERKENIPMRIFTSSSCWLMLSVSLAYSHDLQILS